MKSTFTDFLRQNPTCSKFKNNKDANIIFDIINSDQNIIRAIEKSDNNIPALAVTVNAIEDFVDGQTNAIIDLTDSFTRAAIGKMVKSVLAPFGYVVSQQKSLPKEIHSKYFKSASCYHYDPNTKRSMYVIKTIAPI